MKILLLILSFTITPLFGVSQSDVQNIDKRVKEIQDSLAAFKKIEKINSPDGTRWVYVQKNQLRLISVTANESLMVKKVDWYFISGQLAYAETNWVDNNGKLVFNEKCYLHNGHLVAWTNSRNAPMDSTSAEYKKMEADLVAYGLSLANERE